MNSGCICCSLVGDFGEALKKVLKEFTPDRILIEPSGVGKLSDVIRAVQDPKMTEEKRKAYRSQYDSAIRFLGVSPYLLKITDEGDVK